MAPQDSPFVDPGNRLLAPVRADLETGTVHWPDGTRYAVVTIRTASVTLTVMLDAAGFATWMRVLTALQNTMGAGIQVVTQDQARDLGLNGQH
jgi:hypothetical protein